MKRHAGRKRWPPYWNCAAPRTCSARPASWLPVFVNTPVPRGGRHAMPANNEAPERQAHDALQNLGRQVEAAQRDDESARSAPPAPQPNQDAPAAPQPNQELEARKRLELLVQRAQLGDEG